MRNIEMINGVRTPAVTQPSTDPDVTAYMKRMSAAVTVVYQTDVISISRR